MACYGTIQAGFAHWYIISFRGVGRSFFFPKPCAFGESGAISESSSMGPILI